MFHKIRVLPLSVLFALINAFPKTSVFACAVCFGGAGGAWIQGFTWGVALLAVLPFLMIVGFVAWIALSIRKHSRRQQPPLSAR
jgi:hypothetical protein